MMTERSGMGRRSDDNREHCSVHEDYAAIINKLDTNIEWLVKIGKWGVGVGAAVIAVMVPLSVSFLVFISDLNTRVTNIESKLSDHIAAAPK